MRCYFFSSVPWLVDNLADFQSIIVKIRGSVFLVGSTASRAAGWGFVMMMMPGPFGLQ